MTGVQRKIVYYLTKGYTTTQVSLALNYESYSAHSVSFVEKEINKLKKEYDAITLFELAWKISKSGEEIPD